MQKLTNFSVTLYGEVTPYNQTMSKSRVKIFSKGMNANRSFIDEDVAEQLISTLPYTPVKGIYDGVDFQGHRKNSEEIEQIYGLVPTDMNFSWEEFEEDGKTVEYACADVLLWSSIYPESKEIVGKSQSMELFGPAIEGYWEIDNGIKFFRFTKASFLGLQILGDQTMPAFKSAGFYEAYTTFAKALEEHNIEENEGGTHNMPKPNFKRQSSEQLEALWNHFNVNFTEENEWVIEYEVLRIDEATGIAEVFNYETGEVKQYLVSANEDGTLNVEDEFEIIVEENEVDTTELEKILDDPELEAEIIADSEEENNFSEVEENGTQTEESIVEETTLEVEDEMFNLVQQLEERNKNLEEELEVLRDYKYQIERQEKLAVLNHFAAEISEELIEEYTANLDDYTARDLEKELAYVIYTKNEKSIFSTRNDQLGHLPKDAPTGGITEVLDKYKYKK